MSEVLFTMLLTSVSSMPICVVSTTLFFVCWTNVNKPRDQATDGPRRSLDYVGSSLLVTAAVLVVFAFQNEGLSETSSWSHAAFIIPLVIGLASWTGVLTWSYLINRSRTLAVMPALPITLFANRYYTSGVVSTLFLGFPLFLLVFSVPIRAQVLDDKHSFGAAVVLMPMLGATAVGTLAGACLNTRRNFMFECMIIGALLSVLGCALLATMPDPEAESKLLGYLAIVGFGIGLSTATATLQVTVEIPPQDHGMSIIQPVEPIKAPAKLL